MSTLLVAEVGIVSSDGPIVAGGVVVQNEADYNFTLTSYAPTVAVETFAVVEPPKASFSLTSYEPTVTAGNAINIPLVALTLTTYLPTTVAITTVDAAFSDAASFAEATPFTPEFSLPVSFEMTSTTTADAAYALLDELLLGADSTGSTTVLATFLDSLGITDQLLYSALLQALDTISLVDTQGAVPTRVAATSDQLVLTSPVSAVLTCYAQLLDALVLEALPVFITGLTAADAVDFQEALTRVVHTYATGESTLALLAELTTALGVQIADVASLADQGTLSVSAWLQAVDSFTFVVRLPQGTAEYQAWVMNADNLGVTQYSNFPFDSLTQFNNKLYAVAEDGLYLLQGTSDNGEAIAAHVLTGMMHFGNEMQPKLCPRAYLYVKSDSEILVETVSDILGQRTSTWYRLTARTDSAIASRTLELNSSEEGTHWAFRIENVDGGTLDLRGLQVSPRSLRYIQFTN